MQFISQETNFKKYFANQITDRKNHRGKYVANFITIPIVIKNPFQCLKNVMKTSWNM